MPSSGAIANLINSTTDTALLLSLVDDELMLNYRSYIKSNITSSTYDYSSLSTKVAYDAFVNSVNTTVSGNIQSETIRTKRRIIYVKQYNLDGVGNKVYTYRITNDDNPVVVTQSASSTTSPAEFVNDVQTVEQSFTIHVLKTTVIQTYVANNRDDLLAIPSTFADLQSSIPPTVSMTHYALRSMLLNYYTKDVSISTTRAGAALVALGLIAGLLLISVKFNITNISILLLTSILPIVLAFLDKPEVSEITQEYIDRQGLFNNYMMLTGALGTIASLVLIGVSMRSRLNVSPADEYRQ